MAAVGSSPSGFSYAQAAKGRSTAATSQAGSSKVTSGAATPATGASFLELPSGRNWADDVEASVGDKAVEVQKPAQETGRSASVVKESAVERAKSEDKAQASTSGISSPDLAASSSTTTKDDDSSSAPTNGSSSETTWETKSQVSEPAWIAERKERQSSSQNSDNTVKADKKNKDTSSTPPPKPVVLQEAPPPSINFWAKRAEEAKAKAATVPVQSRPAPSPQAQSTISRENQRPRADSRRKANSVSSVPKPGESPLDNNSEQRKPASAQNKRGSEARINNPQQSAKPASEETQTANHAKAGAQTRSSLPNPPIAPPLVKDEVSWPTPETTTDKEQKAPTDKQSPEKSAEEETPTSKPRQKQQWQPMPVTPNIIWETPGIKGINSSPRGGFNGERGGRGGSVRGRGGARGGANGSNGERTGSRRQQSHAEEDGSASAAQRGRSDAADREAMPPPPKPVRAASAGSRREKTIEPRQDRSVRGDSLTEIQSLNKPESTPSEEQTAVSSWVEAQSNLPRTDSPGQIDKVAPEPREDERIPEPIPRQSSTSSQSVKVEQAEKPAREGPPIRMVPSESRKEPRAFDNYGAPIMNGSTRGAKRNGRGRGGSREFANGHQPSHAYANGDFSGGAAYGVPPSPSFSTPRGNHYTFPSRGGWRGNPRAGSLPMEGFYNRAGYGYGPPVQTVPQYVPGMYDYNGYPVTAMPYQPLMEQQYLMAMVSMQLEYYFSIDNLLKDMFLRKNMDSQGWVLLDVVASFNRLKQLTQDRNLLREVCFASDTIEIKVGDDSKERLRRREGYEQFVLEKSDRETSAQNEGPQQLHPIERPAPQGFGAMAGRTPASAGPSMQPRYDRRSYDSSYSGMNGATPAYANFAAMPQAGYGGEMMNGDDMRGRAAKSPIRENVNSPTSQTLLDEEKDSEPDNFPDEQISVLNVTWREKSTAPFHSASTRTFSNGSIDSRSIFGELEKAKATEPTMNGDSTVNGTDSTGAERHVSPTNAHSLDRDAPAPEMLVYWMKDQPDPSGSLPSDHLPEPYTQLRYRALDQRNHAATGTCPYDLSVLYQFWCHFLIRNFNSRMYAEFKYYALDDSKTRDTLTGLQSLVKFYDQALNSRNPVRDRVLKDYVELVCNEPAKLEGQAFKQLRQSWRNGALNLKSRKKLSDILDEGLKARLDES